MTRRGLLGAATGAGAGYVLAGPVLDAVAGGSTAECDPELPPVPASAIAVAARARAVWTADSHGTTITSRPGPGVGRGRSIDVGGAPVDMAISPDGRVAVVSTGFYDRPGLAIVDVGSGGVRRVEVGPDPGAVAFAPASGDAFVLGRGPEGTLTRVRAGAAPDAPIPVGPHPRGIAIAPEGRLLVALNGGAALAVVELDPVNVSQIQTDAFPSRIALLGRGRRAVVTHDGFGAHRVSVIDLADRDIVRSTKVGDAPAAVAAAGSGAAVVTRSGHLTVLDRRGKRRGVVSFGAHFVDVAVAHGRAWALDGPKGRVHRIGGVR